MVGLRILLESHNKGANTNKINHPQVISKATVVLKPSISPPPPSPPWHPAADGFLDRCFLCGRRLLPGKDIYMYKGDRAFCSVDCRCRQIIMDEEQSIITTTNTTTVYNSREINCSLSASKGPTSSQSSSSSSPPSSSSRNRKDTRNRANGFTY